MYPPSLRQFTFCLRAFTFACSHHLCEDVTHDMRRMSIPPHTHTPHTQQQMCLIEHQKPSHLARSNRHIDIAPHHTAPPNQPPSLTMHIH
mmetsp:Transcript_14330/g.41198  ORF Transcript_14330/g.41198 Transcript_14330/m.41198 type:complete len:90 (-) Transcript_14330:990-1259(-)